MFTGRCCFYDCVRVPLIGKLIVICANIYANVIPRSHLFVLVFMVRIVPVNSHSRNKFSLIPCKRETFISCLNGMISQSAYRSLCLCC